MNRFEKHITDRNVEDSFPPELKSEMTDVFDLVLLDQKWKVMML